MSQTVRILTYVGKLGYGVVKPEVPPVRFAVSEVRYAGTTPSEGKAGAMSDQHQNGRWEAQAEDAARLAEALRGMVGTGELRASQAHEIYAAVHGVVEADEEFPDGSGGNVINGTFGS